MLPAFPLQFTIIRSFVAPSHISFTACSINRHTKGSTYTYILMLLYSRSTCISWLNLWQSKLKRKGLNLLLYILSRVSKMCKKIFRFSVDNHALCSNTSLWLQENQQKPKHLCRVKEDSQCWFLDKGSCTKKTEMSFFSQACFIEGSVVRNE